MLETQHILQRFLFFLQFMKNPWKKCEKIFKKTLVFPTRTYYNGGTILALAGYIISRRKTYEKEAEAGRKERSRKLSGGSGIILQKSGRAQEEIP